MPYALHQAILGYLALMKCFGIEDRPNAADRSCCLLLQTCVLTLGPVYVIWEKDQYAVSILNRLSGPPRSIPPLDSFVDPFIADLNAIILTVQAGAHYLQRSPPHSGWRVCSWEGRPLVQRSRQSIWNWAGAVSLALESAGVWLLGCRG